ncbi:MAG: hypothetical protein JSR26_00960 [Proteobacteria bacterium]|nr:hypothetical protein [Pseudomonadota bacterium]
MPNAAKSKRSFQTVIYSDPFFHRACEDPLVTSHPAYLGAISDPDLRALSHRQWLQEGISEGDLMAIRTHMQQERALGSLRFQSMVEKTLNRPATVRPRGRPPTLLAERREI